MSEFMIYAEFDTVCLVIMLMITLRGVTLTRQLSNQHLYMLMMVSAMVLVASDLCYELCEISVIPKNGFTLYLFNSLYFIFSIGISFLWNLYTLRIMEHALLKSKLYMVIMSLPVVTLALISATDYLNGWIFYFDETGYHRGEYSILFTVVPLIYFLAPIIFAWVEYYKLRSKDSVRHLKTVIAFAFFPIAAVGMQLFFQGYPAVCIGASLGMLQVFLNDIAQDREDLLIHETAVKAKSEFFAGMSHELRTPINAILGMNTMILREEKDDTVMGYARNVENSGKLLLTLVNDILDLSKIEAGKMRLVLFDYRMKDLIKDLVYIMEPRAKEKKLDFQIDIDSDLPSVLHGDEIRIKQVILNMLTNAVKYTETGYIKLKISLENADNINTEAAKADIKVEVSDSGCGMTRDQLKTIFSPYERFEENSVRKMEGTGLGMSISKQLLTLMGSNMEVESEYGIGSIFSFVLSQEVSDPAPLGEWKKETIQDELNEKSKKNVKYQPSFVAEGRRILAVDDTAINLKVFKALLKETKLFIDTVTSGAEALEKVKEVSYDMIFIDIMMPEMDGVETLKQMHSQENLVKDNTPMIAFTANALAGAREEFLSEGFTDYISKPVEIATLEKMIQRYLGI